MLSTEMLNDISALSFSALGRETERKLNPLVIHRCCFYRGSELPLKVSNALERHFIKSTHPEKKHLCLIHAFYLSGHSSPSAEVTHRRECKIR